LKAEVTEISTLNELTKLFDGEYEIDVGILDKSSDSHDPKDSAGPTIGDIARWNEFGEGVPARPWLRDWFDAERGTIEDLAHQQLLACLRDSRPMNVAMQLVAVKAAASCQNRIVSGYTYEPNAPSTIRRKKSSTPLIATGVLKSAIVGRAAKR